VATVRVDTPIARPAAQAWDAVADVGRVHERLLPGRVAAARVEGDTRILTMPDGHEVRELILAVDHHLRRMAYAVVEGQRMPLTFHHASFQVFTDGEQSRLVWTTDLLPDTMATLVRGVMERGIAEIRQTLEA